MLHLFQFFKQFYIQCKQAQFYIFYTFTILITDQVLFFATPSLYSKLKGFLASSLNYELICEAIQFRKSNSFGKIVKANLRT
jgi:hypothetical protein